MANAAFEPSCDNACDSGTPFTFTMEGDASVVNNLVSKQRGHERGWNVVLVGVLTFRARRAEAFTHSRT